MAKEDVNEILDSLLKDVVLEIDSIVDEAICPICGKKEKLYYLKRFDMSICGNCIKETYSHSKIVYRVI